jgi:hypothetical protein
MTFGLRLFVFGLCLFGGVKLLGLAIAWLKILFKKLEPDRFEKLKW